MKTQFFQSVPTLESERLILRRLTQADADALGSLAHSDVVYRYLPTFLYEQKYPDIRRVMDGLYGECLRDSLILGIFLRENERFCGLAEMYGLRNAIHKISIGYRLAEPYWGKGIASETVALMTGYLLRQTDIEINRPVRSFQSFPVCRGHRVCQRIADPLRKIQDRKRDQLPEPAGDERADHPDLTSDRGRIGHSRHGDIVKLFLVAGKPADILRHIRSLLEHFLPETAVFRETLDKTDYPINFPVLELPRFCRRFGLDIYGTEGV